MPFLKPRNPLRVRWLRLSLPAMGEQSAITLGGVALAMLHGRIGATTLAAVGAGDLIFILLQALFHMVSTGIFVVVARLCGGDNKDEARQAVNGAISVTALASTVLAVACFFLAPFIMRLSIGGGDAALHADATLYLKLVLLILPFSSVNLVADNALRSMGDMKTPFRTALTVNLLNLVLTFLFIYSPLRTQNPIVGICLSTVIIRTVECLYKFSIFLRGRNPLGLCYRPGRVRFDLLRRAFSIGWPAMLEMLVMQVGFVFAQRFMAALGVVALAGYQVANRIISIIYQPCSGIGMASGALAGNSIGAVRMADARFFGRDPLRHTAWVSALASAALFFAYMPLVRLFTDDPALIDAALTLRPWFIVTGWLVACANVGAWTIKGAGDTRTMFFISNAGLFLVRIVGYATAAYLFMEKGILLIGVFTMLDFIVRTSLIVWRVWRGKWMYVNV